MTASAPDSSATVTCAGTSTSSMTAKSLSTRVLGDLSEQGYSVSLSNIGTSDYLFVATKDNETIESWGVVGSTGYRTLVWTYPTDSELEYARAADSSRGSFQPADIGDRETSAAPATP